MNRHITGYSDYLTHLKTGASSVAAADRLFGSYESAIMTQAHKAVPTLASATLTATFTMHITGTSPCSAWKRPPTPRCIRPAGADMFAGCAATIADHQTTLRVMQPMLSSALG